MDYSWRVFLEFRRGEVIFGTEILVMISPFDSSLVTWEYGERWGMAQETYGPLVPLHEAIENLIAMGCRINLSRSENNFPADSWERVLDELTLASL